MRRMFIALITFVGGAFFLIEFLLPAQAPAALGGWRNPLSPFLQIAINLVIILGTMAFLLGPINLVRSNVTNLVKKREGWISSLVFLVFLGLGATAQISNDWAEASANTVSETTATELDERVAPAAEQKSLGVQFFELLFYGLVMAFGAASIALLALYLVSAAFRSFRFQNLDAGVMMITAVIVLIGLAPLADLLTTSLPRFLQPNTWAQWILEVPNTAVQRAVAMGVCAGAFAVGTRLWLSIGTRTE